MKNLLSLFSILLAGATLVCCQNESDEMFQKDWQSTYTNNYKSID
jgi:hypothetical protein